MSGKNQYPLVIDFQDTDPTINFRPTNQDAGSPPSGVAAGAMSGTDVIYSQIMEKSRMDNIGLEVTWTGDPSGTIEVLVSNSGMTFYALTFNPVLDQPAGSAGGYAIDLNQLPFKYLLIRYTGDSGTGTLTVFGQFQDLN